MAQDNRTTQQYWDAVEEVARVDKTANSWYSIRIAHKTGSEDYIVVQELYTTRTDPTPRPSSNRMSFPVRIAEPMLRELIGATGQALGRSITGK
jgi:hypothetical protein